jgi:DNA-binding PadR family transcriptional regulator
MSDRQKKYAATDKGKDARTRARKKYDEKDTERRRKQKREYMRRKRERDPGYCKWKK